MGETAIKAIGMLPITCNPGHTELEVSLYCLNKQQRNNIITMRNKEQQRNNKQRKQTKKQYNKDAQFFKISFLAF